MSESDSAGTDFRRQILKELMNIRCTGGVWFLFSSVIIDLPVSSEVDSGWESGCEAFESVDSCFWRELLTVLSCAKHKYIICKYLKQLD